MCIIMQEIVYIISSDSGYKFYNGCSLYRRMAGPQEFVEPASSGLSSCSRLGFSNCAVIEQTSPSSQY